MLFNSQNHYLFVDFISHEELLGGSRDVSVVVEDSHAVVSGDVHLHGDVSAEIGMNLGLFSWEDSRVNSGSCIVKALVSDFIDHLLYQYLL